MREKRSRKIQHADQMQHYDELETETDPAALERFRRPAYYQSVNVAEYLAKKYGIRGDVDGQA